MIKDKTGYRQKDIDLQNRSLRQILDCLSLTTRFVLSTGVGNLNLPRTETVTKVRERRRQDRAVFKQKGNRIN